MTLLLWLAAGAVGLLPLAVLARFSVGNLLQARLLNRWRYRSLDDLADRAAALRGEVRVENPLRVLGIGDCLWHRKELMVTTGGSQSSESDVTRKARFSIVVEGRFFSIPDPPTEATGVRYASKVVGKGRWIRSEWFPVVGHLTVVGRFRKSGARWEIARDPVAGLLISPHPPARIALKKAVTGWLGLAVAATGLAALAWILVIFFP